MIETTFTFWKSRYAKECHLRSASWEDWVTELTTHTETDVKKAMLPGLVLGRMVDGDRRKNNNVKTIEALALDLERNKTTNEYTQDIYLRLLKTALSRVSYLEYIAYTTFSHTPEDPRIRLIFPVAERLHPSEYKKGMSWLNTLVGPVIDLEAQKLSQPVYLPRHPVGAREFWAIHHAGVPVDIQDDLATEVVVLRQSLGEGHGRAPHEASIRQACKEILLGRPYAAEGHRDETAMRILWHLSKYRHDISMEALEELFFWSNHQMADDSPDLDNLYSKLCRGVEKRVELESSTISADEAYIIQYRTSYYCKLKSGGFSRAYLKDEIALAIKTHLSGIENVQLRYIDNKGESKTKTLPTILNEYGVLADKTQVDLVLATTKFEDHVLREATVDWPQNLEAEFNPEINQWLNLLGGEKLKDWLSILSDLNRLSSALVLMGPKNIGKTLLAMGCASRFGSSAPAKQGSLTGRFQEELARCPLIYIDEDIDENPYDRNFLASIRSELSIRERSIDRKYLPSMQMQGAIRCIISSNHLPFKTQDSQTAQDLAAIAERFYWIEATTTDAADYLHKMGAEKLEYWRKQGIIRHIKYLEETRSVPFTSRFGVSGDSEALADLINTGVRWNRWVTEWVVNGVLDGFVKLRQGDKDVVNGAVVYKGSIYVRVRAVVKAWERYLANIRVAPDTRPISEALRGISEDKTHKPRDIGIQKGNNQQRYYKIRTSTLIALVERLGTNIEEELLEAISKGDSR